MPYSSLYRLTRQATELVLESNPYDPLTFSTPPPAKDVDSNDGSGPLNVFGAMCQVLPEKRLL